MTNTTLIKEIRSLPAAYVAEVADFVGYLKHKHPQTVAKPLTDERFEAGDECPMDHTPNAETIAAMQEARDILSGKIQAKRYSSLAEFDAELAAEDVAGC
jgi:hypothetical protein